MAGVSPHRHGAKDGGSLGLDPTLGDFLRKVAYIGAAILVVVASRVMLVTLRPFRLGDVTHVFF